MSFFNTTGGITLCGTIGTALIVSAIAIPVTIYNHENGPVAKINACSVNGGTWTETETNNSCTAK